RRGGVVEQPRRLLSEVAADFREMPDAGVMNWCCGGGGGVSANTRADPLRLHAFKVKKRQIEATGVHTLITACATCRIVIEEGLEHNHMEVEVIGLTELFARYLFEEPAP
ncbi:MAG: heterodisulfide reductase-related iron-sulfur binding cluster, partial [Gallionella sp.]|nr:heterodisulfide reductase-related iron-sulfur binding cluster [Gallionella sp.]